MRTTRHSAALASLAAAGLLLTAAGRAGAGGLLDILFGRGRGGQVAAVVTLRDGQAVTNLAGRAGTASYFRIHVPDGQHRLTVETAGGQGDADLYLQHGSAPTATNYLHRSASNANGERIVVPRPTAGWWYVMVRGFNGYAGVSLVARMAPGAGVGPPVVVPGGPEKIVVLRPNQSVTGLAGRNGSRQHFQLHVPPGTRVLSLTTSGGSGDCDLYLSRESLPEPKSYQYVSNGGDTAESITVRLPAPGTWYALVYGYRAFGGVTLAGAWAGHPPVPAPQPPPPPQPVRRWVRIESPTTGVTLKAGQSYWVQWSTSGHTRRIRVLQSFDDGRTWTDIAPRSTAPAGEGKLAWTVPLGAPRVTAATVRVRVLDMEDPAIFSDTGRILVARGPGHPAPGHPGPADHGKAEAYEPNNQSSRASQIGVNTMQKHTIYGKGDEDWIMFIPPATGMYRFTFDEVTVKLEVRLYAAKVGSSREDKSRTFTVGSSGYAMNLDANPNLRYVKFQVQAKDDGDTGAYRIAVQRVVPVPAGGLRPKPIRK